MKDVDSSRRAATKSKSHSTAAYWSLMMAATISGGWSVASWLMRATSMPCSIRSCVVPLSSE